MPFRFRRLEIPEVVLIEPVVFEDERGFFLEAYKRSDFEAFGITDDFIQDNHSRSTRGVLRGLHYQKPPRAQAKLVRVIAGTVFDVAVDIRSESPTRGRWVAAELSADNRRMLYIPAGFAHGLCALSEEAEVLYKASDEYAPDLERGILWNDPGVGVTWPIEEPLVSARDTEWPTLDDAGNDF